jgi:hypothetical protein
MINHYGIIVKGYIWNIFCLNFFVKFQCYWLIKEFEQETLTMTFIDVQINKFTKKKPSFFKKT